MQISVMADRYNELVLSIICSVVAVILANTPQLNTKSGPIWIDGFCLNVLRAAVVNGRASIYLRYIGSPGLCPLYGR
jgi:hypothetical protein